MDIAEAVKIAPAVTAVVAVTTGVYSLTTTQRDRSLAKFAQDMISEPQLDAPQCEYWAREGADALRRLHAKREVPARFIAVPLGVCVYTLSVPYALGDWWRDIADDPSWRTWVFWPQSTWVDIPPIMFLGISVVLTGIMLRAICRLFGKRDALSGRPPHPGRLAVWSWSMAALFLLVHAIGVLRAFSTRPPRHVSWWPLTLSLLLILGAVALSALAFVYRREDSFWDRWRATALPAQREDTDEDMSDFPENGDPDKVARNDDSRGADA